jgi:hypothetical protein
MVLGHRLVTALVLKRLLLGVFTGATAVRRSSCSTCSKQRRLPVLLPLCNYAANFRQCSE